jgi:hypothetical protein
VKLSTFLIVSALVYAIFGIVLLVAPNLVLMPLGAMSMEQATEQSLGAMLIGSAVLVWFARDIQDGQAIRAIVLGNLVANALVFVVSVEQQLLGVWNTPGWVLVAISLLTLGYAYFLIRRPSEVLGTKGGQ